MKVFILALACGSLAASCRDSSYPKDKFFDAPPELWVDNARRLPPQEIYRLYRVSLYAFPPPPDTRLAEALGEHGRVAVDLWASDLERTGSVKSIPDFGPILFHAYYRGGFSVCRDDPLLYGRIVKALRRTWRFRREEEARKMVEAYCFNNSYPV